MYTGWLVNRYLQQHPIKRKFLILSCKKNTDLEVHVEQAHGEGWEVDMHETQKTIQWIK